MDSASPAVSPKKSIEWLNLASVLSALAVVILHANGRFWIYDGGASYWPSANIIESVFYFAVPVFFMISGATLLDYNERYGLGTYFKKRALKTLLPYAVWSLLGLLFRLVYLRNVSIQDITPSFLLTGLLQGNLVDIYWFFIPLFCVYLCIPLLAAVPKEKRQTLFTYFAIVGFVINALVPFLISVFHWQVGSYFSVTVCGNYLLYTIIGYLLTHGDIKLPVRLALYGTGLGGLLMLIIGTAVLTEAAGEIVKTYKDYQNVPCILYAVAVFVALRYGGQRLLRVRWVSTLIRFLSDYTFAVYLMHWYCLQVAIGTLHLDDRTLLFRLGLPFLIVAFVVGVTWLVRKIPGMRKIVP